jgi:dUTP pyrophosphatase
MSSNTESNESNECTERAPQKNDNQLRFIRLDNRAVDPKRGTPQSVGIDLFLTRLIKVEGNVHYYGTDLSVRTPPNTFSLLYSRSSLAKSGYTLGNGVGVIDPDYRGELIVQLVPIDIITSRPLELPFKAVQLVVMPTCEWCNTSPITIVNSAELYEEAPTVRGTGGFGSTGN